MYIPTQQLIERFKYSSNIMHTCFVWTLLENLNQSQKLCKLKCDIES